MADRGRGSRFVRTDCMTCEEEPAAPDTARDAHRVWAQRHADRTGHTVLVETTATRSYKPRSRPESQAEPGTVDLLAALQRSVDAAKAARLRPGQEADRG